MRHYNKDWECGSHSLLSIKGVLEVPRLVLKHALQLEGRLWWDSTRTKHGFCGRR